MEYYSALQNGAHSLVTARVKLEQYFDNHEDERNIFLLKEATMFLSHGIEILLKDLLCRLDPEKVIDPRDLGKFKKKLCNFDKISEFNKILVISKLRTINLKKANEVVKKHAIFQMSSSFYNQVKIIRRYRNELFHFTFSSLEEALNYYNDLWKTITAAEVFFGKNLSDYRNAAKKARIEYTTSDVIADRISKMTEEGRELSSIETYEAEMEAHANMMDALERRHS